MPIFDNLITPLKSVIVKDIVSEILQSEIEAQIQKACELGFTFNEIEQEINFKVYNDRIFEPDAGDMPCVIIFPSRMDFSDSTQDLSMCKSEIELCVEMYCSATSGEDDCGCIINADKNALSRLNYLTSQVFSILMSQASESVIARKLIESIVVEDWVMLKPKKQSAESILGARFVFKIKAKEYLKTFTGNELRELYVKLNVRDEFVSTIIKQILKK